MEYILLFSLFKKKDMRKVVFIFVSLLLFCNNAKGTPQTPDLLIYKGDTLYIYPFIVSNRIYNLPDWEEIYKQTRIYESFFSSTNCWRGFISVFEIKNDSLFFVKAYGRDEQEIDLSFVLGKKENVFLDWATDTLTCYQNRIISVHDGNGGYYQNETDFAFENGILKKVEKYENTIKPSVYLDRSDTLMNHVKSQINYKNIEPPKEKIRITIRVDDADTDGNITNVKVRGDEKYHAEAIRVVKTIPWEVIIRRGKKLHRYWTIPVVFEPQD